MDRRARRRLAHGVLVAAASLPLLGLAVGAARDSLGANPVETITHTTGDWALRLLLATLAVTPLRRILGRPGLAPVRRTLGLLAFGYACLHFGTYLVLDLGFDFASLGEDIAKRPYITVGFATFSMLVPLAATSTRAAVRRLGRRWVTLHRLVYAAGVGAVVHFLWLVKADHREPLIYAAILCALLGERLWRSLPGASLPRVPASPARSREAPASRPDPGRSLP